MIFRCDECDGIFFLIEDGPGSLSGDPEARTGQNLSGYPSPGISYSLRNPARKTARPDNAAITTGRVPGDAGVVAGRVPDASGVG